MPSTALTAQFVRSATCPSDRVKVDFFDTRQKGFLLEVRTSGGRTFYQRYVDSRGHQREFKTGPADVLSVNQARQARSVLSESILGADPQPVARNCDPSPTLTQLVRDGYLPHAQASKRSWKVDEIILRIHILPAFGRLRRDEISNGPIAGLINDMRAKGYASATTNRVLVTLRYIFNLARKWNVSGATVNPTTGLATAPEVHRQRFLTPEETQRVIAAINAEENEVAARAIMLLLLTEARRNEVTHAKWEYVDWQRRTSLVPVSKSGRPRAVALNAAAVALLQSLPRAGERINLPLAAHWSAKPIPVLPMGPYPASRRFDRCTPA